MEIDKFKISKWYALYTRARHEKLVEKELCEKGIEAYTPKRTLRRKWSDRLKEVEEPLFKSYCFARFPLIDKKKIFTQRGVVNLVNFSGRHIPVEDSIIGALKILTAGDLKIDPFPYMNKGDRITIKKGPFKGLEGYIIEKRNKNTTLVVSVDAIAASIKCVIEADAVDLIY